MLVYQRVSWEKKKRENIIEHRENDDLNPFGKEITLFFMADLSSMISTLQWCSCPCRKLLVITRGFLFATGSTVGVEFDPFGFGGTMVFSAG
jgi:hypothetical protein